MKFIFASLFIITSIVTCFALSSCSDAKAGAGCHIEYSKVEYYYGSCAKDEVVVGYEANRDVVHCVKQSVVCQ